MMCITSIQWDRLDVYCTLKKYLENKSWHINEIFTWNMYKMMWLLCILRDEFRMKLTLLSNQWQGVVRRSQQRRGIIDSQLRQWHRYREMTEKLRKWLMEVSHQTETLRAGAPVPLQQARVMLDAVQVINFNSNILTWFCS